MFSVETLLQTVYLILMAADLCIKIYELWRD